MADWIPDREQDLMDLCHTWVRVLSDPVQVGAYGWDQAEVTAVLGVINAFLTARSAYEADNTTTKRLVKDEAKGETIDGMRDFANSSIRFNKHMDDPAKKALGVHTRDSTPTFHGPPEDQPATEVENTFNHYEHRVRAMNPRRGDHSKPPGVHGVRYAWQLGGEKPAQGEDLPKTKFSRKTTLMVRHTEADKGKPVYYAACYENSKGDQGKWSPVAEGIIG
ncbi:MAG: hypothetical protein LBU25_07100 [Treponema sp.]|jgi:hypothetical protein|nr:hypothetical protein [Treponema sp.]